MPLAASVARRTLPCGSQSLCADRACASPAQVASQTECWSQVTHRLRSPALWCRGVRHERARNVLGEAGAGPAAQEILSLNAPAPLGAPAGDFPPTVALESVERRRPAPSALRF